MDGSSVTRAPASPTRAIVADEAFCRQAAAVLLCDPEPICDAFLAEPVEEALEMVRWALKHEGDPGFDAARALPSWASTEPSAYSTIECTTDCGWTKMSIRSDGRSNR